LLKKSSSRNVARGGNPVTENPVYQTWTVEVQMLRCRCNYLLPMNYTRHRTLDWLWAGLIALGLTGVGVFIFLVIHLGGFEGAGYLGIIYLPGMLVARSAADHIYQIEYSPKDRVLLKNTIASTE
jgi:hypothetical protein